MNKEQQIEEMVKVIQKAENQCYPLFYCRECKYQNVKGQCCFYNYADKLYKSSYRPIKEVRKETAKEILQRIYSDDKDYYTIDDLIENLAEEYGVEIEE